ncbi:MAG: sulfurtransferase TusA family protein [Candidatus Rokuibacteriota bacterium]
MLVKKFFNVGFEAIEVHDRRPFGFDSLTRYPLFTREFLDFLRRTLPPERHDELVFSLVVTARRPAVRTAPWRCGACRHDNPSDARFCSRCGARLDAQPGTVTVPEAAALLDLGESGCDVGATLKVKSLVATLQIGQVLEVRTTDPGSREDVPAWCRMTGHEFLGAAGPRYFVRKR